MQRGATLLRFQPVEAKLPGLPRASLCAPQGRQACVPAPARVSGCARSPLMRPSAGPAGNNAPKPAVQPAPGLSPRGLPAVHGATVPAAATSCARSWDPGPKHAVGQLVFLTGPTKAPEEEEALGPASHGREPPPQGSLWFSPR